MAEPPVVAVVGLQRPDYIRSITLRAGAERAGIPLEEVTLRGEGRGIRLGALRPALAAIRRADVVVVTYPAYKVVHAVALLARLSGAAVVLDSYVSIVDTKADRGRSRLVLGLARLLERLAVRLVHVVVMDTPEGAELVRARTGRPPGSVGVLGVASVLDPPDTPAPAGERTRVLWYGHGQAMSGIPTIAAAMATVLDATDDVELVVVCRDRPALGDVEALAARHPRRVTVHHGLPLDELHDELRRSDLALGVFGASPKAGTVVPNKVADALCAGLPVITRAGPAVGDLASDAVVLVAPEDPAALADAILELHREPADARRRRREVAAELARERFTLDVFAAGLRRVVDEAAAARRRR